MTSTGPSEDELRLALSVFTHKSSIRRFSRGSYVAGNLFVLLRFDTGNSRIRYEFDGGNACSDFIDLVRGLPDNVEMGEVFKRLSEVASFEHEYFDTHDADRAEDLRFELEESAGGWRKNWPTPLVSVDLGDAADLERLIPETESAFFEDIGRMESAFESETDPFERVSIDLKIRRTRQEIGV